MTQDELTSMAKQAGFVGKIDVSIKELKAFAELVASAASAKEREEIAQFIEKTHLGSLPEETAVHYALLLKSYSTAIRARGEA